MKKRTIAIIIALVSLVQMFVPSLARAIEYEPHEKESGLVSVGVLDINSYPQLDAKAILEIQKQARDYGKVFDTSNGFRLFGVDSPYLPGQNPNDKEKASAYANVKVKFDTEGLKQNGTIQKFQWNEIFGVDSNGNPGKAKIIFLQKDVKTNQVINRFILEISKSGEYNWIDQYMKPAKLPLYSNTLEPYRYEVALDYQTSDKITFLTMEIGKSDSKSSFKKDSEGNIVADIPLELKLGQVASTKFTSEWKTSVLDNDRPTVEGLFDNDASDGDIADEIGFFKFPKNDNDQTILRNDEKPIGEYNGFDEFYGNELRTVPIVKVVAGYDPDIDSATYNLDETNSIITTLDGKKFKYNFEYNVIDGGKLTMTEIIPITFDANGGNFSSITDSSAEQKIIKEVEYGMDLTEKIETPGKTRETFKGWGIKDGSGNITKINEDALKNITEAKTFYAIWDNNELKTEELVVYESFKDENKYVNDFLPTLDKLKEKVKIKGANNNEINLTEQDNLEILNDSNTVVTGDDLKNYLYEKLKEKNKPKDEPTRVETINGKVTTENGKTQEVNISIKVVKNIYEAKTLADKPYYVPKSFVKVTLDPTTKSVVPQKTYYYVNPNAYVTIPGIDPKGSADNMFTEWQVDKAVTKFKDVQVEANKKYELASRYNFANETTITAQYVVDVIPQTGADKPTHVPNNFVKVTFVPTEKATDETNKIFWVNPAKEVKIPVNAPVGKQHFTFENWKIGVANDQGVVNGEVYNPNIAKQFSAETTITATYDEAKDIIPYDPKEPTTRPDGYVRVTFEAEEGLTLTEFKAYYVKTSAKKKLVDIKDGQGFGYPQHSESIGYDFKEWDPNNTNQEINADIVVKAKATQIPDFVEKTEDKPNKPDDEYVTVTFKAEADANGTVTEKVYFVNPNKFVKLVPPTETKGNVGYEFGTWSQDATQFNIYKSDTEITASFNPIDAKIPKKNGKTKPDGYVTVKFEISPNLGGKINDGEITEYYVDPSRAVTINPPATTAEVGYKPVSWSQNTTNSTTYSSDTTITGTFEKLGDIIPKEGDGAENLKPEGYVTITFDKGANGNLKGKTVYYVNPNANPVITLGNSKIVKPTIKPNVGYKVADQAWDKTDAESITNDLTVTAQYTALDDIIPKTNPNGEENTKPDGYITVTFSGEENGTLAGSTAFYINPNKAVVLQNNAPTINPNTGYEAAGWDTSLNKAIKYNDGDVIKAKYNPLNNIYEVQKPGYVKVEFNKGQHGELEGTTNYWIKPGAEVTIPEPTVKPNTGYKFKEWDKTTTITANANDPTYVITATYETIEDIIPGDQAKPNGYVEVKFVADANGTLSGTTLYYVNPDKTIDLTTQAEGIAKNPNVGFTEVDGTWDKTITSKKYTSNETYTFNFKALNDVIPAGDNVSQPKGYVKVDFIAGANGSLEGGNKTYYVNPSKNVKIVDQATRASNEIVVPSTNPDTNYEFDTWSPTIDKTNSITSSAIYEARFKSLKVTMTYDGNGNTEGAVPEALSYDIGTEITLAGGKDLIKNNYVLKGWQIGNTIYKPGDKYKIEQDTNAKAVWEEDFHNVSFNTDGGTYIEPQKVKHGETITSVNSPTKEGFTFTGWKVDGNDFDPNTAKVTEDITLVAQYVPNVIPEEGNGKPDNVPTEYISITVKTTDKATENKTQIFWVAPNKNVNIPVQNPTGKKVERTTTEAEFTWLFDSWKSDEATPREWKDIISGAFKDATTITAQYTKDYAKAGDIVVERYSTTESIKDNNGNFINNYLPTEEEIKSLIKVVDASGTTQALAADDSVEFKIDADKTFDEVIYDKLKENPDNKKYVRTETINAEVTFANGAKKNVEVPIYVYKNIYEGLTRYGKPLEALNAEKAIGEDYIRVALIPTKKATNQQIKVFYVRKNAAVIIPGQDPTGRDNYIFIGWKADKPANQINTRMLRTLSVRSNEANPPVVEDNDDVEINKRHRFDVDTNIEAQFKEEYKPRPDAPGYNPGGVYYPSPIVKTVEKKVEVDKSKKHLELRYMQGNEGMFMPYKSLSRAEAAQILANALMADGYNYKDIDPNIYYSDLKKDAWYLKAVSIVTQAGVFQGFDGKFMPDRDITQGEWIATLVRFQMQGSMVGNNMNVREKHWAIPEVQSAYMVGWLKIYTDGVMNFSVDKAITREEVAAVTNRAFNRVRDFEYTLSNDKSLYNFKDINRDMWSYNEILCATNSFVHNTENYLAHEIENRKYSTDYKYEDLIQDYFQRVLRKNN